MTHDHGCHICYERFLVIYFIIIFKGSYWSSPYLIFFFFLFLVGVSCLVIELDLISENVLNITISWWRQSSCYLGTNILASRSFTQCNQYVHCLPDQPCNIFNFYWYWWQFMVWQSRCQAYFYGYLTWKGIDATKSWSHCIHKVPDNALCCYTSRHVLMDIPHKLIHHVHNENHF